MRTYDSDLNMAVSDIFYGVLSTANAALPVQHHRVYTPLAVSSRQKKILRA